MMFGPGRARKSTKGWKSIGSAPPSTTRHSCRPSIFRTSGLPHSAQDDSTVTHTGSPRKRPCTKGVAIASIAQAAKSASPDAKRIRCGVGSTVTG